MADRYPKSIDEVTAEADRLRAENERLRSQVGPLQSALAERNAEIAQLRKFKPRVLDPKSKDKFARPV